MIASKKVSICGKGGSGKSTVVALLARKIADKGGDVLVVDSDESNSCLFWMLGMSSPPSPLMEMLGGKDGVRHRMAKTKGHESNIFEREEIRKEDIPPEYIRMDGKLSLVAIGKIHQALEGCACPMGVLSREFLKKLRLNSGQVALVDMEAGIEHFGRGVETSIDAVLTVVEPSLESVNLAEKVMRLTRQAGAKFAGAVINKAHSDELESELRGALAEKGIDVICSISFDPRISAACIKGQSVNPGDNEDELNRLASTLFE